MSESFQPHQKQPQSALRADAEPLSPRLALTSAVCKQGAPKNAADASAKPKTGNNKLPASIATYRIRCSTRCIDLPFNKLFGNAMHRKGHIQNMWMTTFAAHSQLDRKVRLHYITERGCFTHALHLEVYCRRCFPPRARYPWSRSLCPHGPGTHGGTATALNRKHDPQPKPQQATGEPETNPRKETQTQPRTTDPP